MNEKMTDETVGILTLRHTMNQAWTHEEQESVLAHIAALTAERDEVERHADAAAEQGREWLRERDALRERVQALEHEATARRTRQEVAEARSAQAERARDTAQTNAERWHARAVAAESLLAAIRQRAGVLEKVLRGVLDNGTRHTVAGINAWNAARAAVAPHVSELDGLQGGWCEPRAETSPAAPLNPDATGEADGPTPELSLVLVAPTTSEAFATVRRGLAANVIRTADVAPAPSALSLLERRMGGLEKAASGLLSALQRAGGVSWLGPEEKLAHDDLCAALTDAPPVFTLEEVREAFSTRADMDDEANIRIFNAMVEALSALRK